MRQFAPLPRAPLPLYSSEMEPGMGARKQGGDKPPPLLSLGGLLAGSATAMRKAIVSVDCTDQGIGLDELKGPFQLQHSVLL